MSALGSALNGRGHGEAVPLCPSLHGQCDHRWLSVSRWFTAIKEPVPKLLGPWVLIPAAAPVADATVTGRCVPMGSKRGRFQGPP